MIGTINLWNIYKQNIESKWWELETAIHVIIDHLQG